LFLETSPAPVKFAVARLGKCAPDVRLPLVAPKEATRERVDAAMVSANLIN
jgi:4-hydroxy-tetrahydrodipicolinate synthase